MKTEFFVIIGIIFLAVSCVSDKKEIIKKEIASFDSIAVASVEILGAHLHWQQDFQTNYQFNLLTSLAYSAYELEPKTGNYKTIGDWETTSLIDTAKQYNVKTYLTVTNFGKENNSLFLDNYNAQNTSINILEELLNQRNAYGVIINFEHIPLKYSDAFSLYIKKLSSQLVKSDKKVIITIPGNITLANSKLFDFQSLNSMVSYYIITYSDLPKDSVDHGGPIAPLFNSDLWNNGSVESAVNFYSNGKIPSSKLIVSIPYFGSKWELSDKNQSLKFIEYLSYKDIKQKYPQKPVYDKKSHTTYINVNEDGKSIRIWYEDPKTLRAKYDYVLDNGLGGIYLWALGYDDGYNELWDVIDEKLWK